MIKGTLHLLALPLLFSKRHSLRAAGSRIGGAIVLLTAISLEVPLRASDASGTSEVVAWGCNSAGQTNVPPNLTNLTAIAAGAYHSLVLKRDGTLAAWGDNGLGQATIPAQATNVAAIASGSFHNLALRKDATVVAWGENTFGQANIPVSATNVVAVAAGWLHSLALKSNGTVVAWGDNGWGQTNVPAGLSGVKAIAAGELHSLALLTNGTVVAWGDNTYGQTNVPTGLTNVAAIQCGWRHCIALQSNGTFVAWGDNANGQANVPAGLLPINSVAGGGAHDLVLQTNGIVVAWGNNFFGQTNIPAGLMNVMAVASGGYHNLALVPTPAPVLVLAWPAPTNVVYGTKLGTNQNNAQANVAGTFLYNPANGSVLPVGTNLLTALFTAADTNLGTTNLTVQLVVMPAPLTITASNLSKIYGRGLTFAGTEFSANGLINGDTVTTVTLISQGAASNAPGGTYAIMPSAGMGDGLANYSIAYSNGILTVTTPALIFNTAFPASGMTASGFRLQVDGADGVAPVEIYASTDLVHWTSIFTNPPIVGPVQFFDSEATNNARRFYRASEF